MRKGYLGAIAASIGCMLFATLASKHAYALEGGVSPYPAGAVGTNIAEMPPIPGLFALEQFNYSFSNGLYGNNGEKLPFRFHSSTFSATTRLLASYPFTLLGANVLHAVGLAGRLAAHECCGPTRYAKRAVQYHALSRRAELAPCTESDIHQRL